VSGFGICLCGFFCGSMCLMSIVEVVVQCVVFEFGCCKLVGELIVFVGDEYWCGIGEDRCVFWFGDYDWFGLDLVIGFV